jgi:hypothetical protein
MNQEVLAAARTSTLGISIVVQCIHRGIEGREKAILFLPNERQVKEALATPKESRWSR